MEKFYGPEEDTYFLIEAIKEYFETNTPKRSLEIGVGNGQVSKLISENSIEHIGVDINPNAIEETKRVCSKGNYFESDLFSKVSGKFDLIAFNPPYLPERKDEEDDWIKKAIVGGKKGYEIILRFLEELPNYLEDKGVSYLLFTELSVPEVILEKCKSRMLNFEKVLEKSVMMEKMYVYRITKSNILKHLESKGYSDVKFFAKGSHGKVFTANKDNKKVSIKVLNEENKAYDAIKNEAEKMQIVNEIGIGPKFIEVDLEQNYMSYEFVDGIAWQKYYSKLSVEEIKEIILNILEQCYKMDEIGFEKKEMQRPINNVLIENRKPILIDFERGIKTDKPSNITQFLQYLVNSKFASFIREKGIKIEREKIIELGLNYKNKEIDFESIKIYVLSVFEKT